MDTGTQFPVAALVLNDLGYSVECQLSFQCLLNASGSPFLQPVRHQKCRMTIVTSPST